MNPQIPSKKSSALSFRKLFKFWWEKSFIRFLLVGGVNTTLGYLTTLGLRYTVFVQDPKWILLPEFIELDGANTVMFLLLFPVSYSLQACLAFRSKWQWQRMLIYPLTSIPNYLIQQGMIFFFETGLRLMPAIAYALAAVFAIPVMFFVIRVFVKTPTKPIKKLV